MNLDRLFAPRSIAIFGASDTPMSFGWRILTTLRALGFAGDVYPINPKYDEVLGLKCFPDFEAIPEGVDAVAFCVNGAIVEEQFLKAARRRIGSAAIYDAGPEGVVGLRRTKEIALDHGIAVCGPNGMGTLSPATRSSLYSGTLANPDRLSGNVGLITQSGAIAVGLLTDCRRYGFSHIASTGNEAVVQTHDFLNYLVDDPATRVVALFVESIRNLDGFITALDRAAAARKPVVVLKVGQSDRGKRAALGHTGAIAGDGRAFSEVLRRHRAIEVRELDELVEVLAACQSTRFPAGPRIGHISASGGQVDLIHDVVHRCGYDLPELSAETRRRLADEIGVVTPDGNPLDAWGNGDWQKNLPRALRLVDEEQRVDSVVFTSDTFDDQPMIPTRYAPMVLEAANASRKPHYFFNTRPGIFRQENADLFKGSAVAMIGGISQGLGAVHKLGVWAASTVHPPAPSRLAVLPDLAGAGEGRTSIHEGDAKRLFAAAGLPVGVETTVTARERLSDAAALTGFPCVLKVLSDEIPHRSEHGLVRTGLADVGQLESAFDDMQSRLAAMTLSRPAEFLVQAQASGVTELFAGINVDPEVGPSLLVGPGGVLVELLNDVAIRPLPLREGDVEAMLGETKLGVLLDGFRGQPPGDRAAVVETLYRFAELGARWGRTISEMEINPLIVRREGEGCVVVDAIIVPAPPPSTAS